MARGSRAGTAVLLLVWLIHAPPAAAAEETDGTSFEVFGFAMTDSGYNFGTIDPNWYDVVRPSKLPAFPGQFGEDGRFFISVRQSRLGVKSKTPSPLGDLKVHLEAELFGVGVDAGRTTFRLRHAFGELGQFGAGQTWSTFMDPDVFPNSLEYWGPSGMVFFRNAQVRWKRSTGLHTFQVTLENPGGSADIDDYSGRIELENVSARLPVPDVAAHYRLSGRHGHIQLAGILRYLKWDDVGPGPTNLSGDAVGWGVNLSGNWKYRTIAVLRLQLVGGEAIQNYMNDAVTDIAVEPRDDATRPLVGVPLRSVGTVAFLDLEWNRFVTTSIGHSFMRIWNSEGQADTAIRIGNYALANVLIHPTEDWLFGPELQWGERRNFRGGYTYDEFRVQFSMKYSFARAFSLD